MRCSVRWSSILGLLVAGCATATPGTKPHDMSAAQHDLKGREQDARAQVHAARFDANVKFEREGCPADTACWTWVTDDPMAERRIAEDHQRQAAAHRAASAALSVAEAHACGGINPDDRDMSPFEHIRDIASVEPLTERSGTSKTPSERMVGAIVTFRPVAGMTAEWLQRVVDCHLARNASLGHVVLDMPDCPLVPNGAQARVNSTGSLLAVEIRSDDNETSREILLRAMRLRPVSKGPAVPAVTVRFSPAYTSLAAL